MSHTVKNHSEYCDKVLKYYRDLEDQAEKIDNPFHFKHEAKNIPVTSVVQLLRNRELGVQKPHTRDVTDFLEIHEDILRVTGGLSKCTRSSKRHKRVACFQRRYKNCVDYFTVENRYFGSMDMPSPSVSCKSQSSEYDSDEEMEESDMREPRL